MNLLIKKVALLLLLAAVFFSCEDPKDIGLDLQPQNQDFGVFFTDTITVVTTTVLVDSVRTSNSPYLLAGRYLDSKLGPIAAKSFFQVRYGSTAYNLGDAPVFDSLVLFLDYVYEYGNTGRFQNLYVHQLQDSIQRKTYYNYDEAGYSLNPVGKKEQFAAKLSSDSLSNLTIRLNENLGQNLMGFSGQEESEFLKAFYGLALIGAPDDNGAIIGINPSVSTSNAGTKLRLYYHNGTSTTPVFYDFYLDGRNYVNIKNETPLAGLQNPYDAISSANTNEETFVQAGIGLMTRIEFPYIQKLNEKGRIAINRTELEILPVEGTQVNSVNFPPILTLYKSGTDKKIPTNSPTLLFDPLIKDFSRANNFQQASQKASYNATSKSYAFSISEYINSILNEGSSVKALYLSVPSAELGLSSASYEHSVGRLVIGSNNHPNTPIKLKLYYTIANN
jgi:hypothetical protein